MDKGMVRCQRIGCDATFIDDDSNNVDGSCRFHASGVSVLVFPYVFSMLRHIPYGINMFIQPIFHDGMKEWSCCKQRSHDFSLFLEIPGCKTGKHTTEKPVIKPVSANPPQKLIPTVVPNRTTDANCSRCRQGFFCSDHGSQLNSKATTVFTPAKIDQAKTELALPKKIVGLDEPQICKNKGCGKTFKEKDNHDAACEYHPGPAVFHDRIRGWKCCDVHVKEFDEFMSIPPCTKGWHNADAA